MAGHDWAVVGGGVGVGPRASDEQSVEMLAASIASLLQMPREEVRALLPQRSVEPRKNSSSWSECSGTSGYGSQHSPTSPPPRKDSDQSTTSLPSSPPNKQTTAATMTMTTAVKEDELEEAEAGLAAALAKGRESRVPKPGYLCRICFRPGHLIFDCPAKHLTLCATPYKGPKQCYGEFACPGCKRKWKSAKSFADKGQDCKFCAFHVYPHRQYSLERAVQEGRLPRDKLPTPDPNRFL